MLPGHIMYSLLIECRLPCPDGRKSREFQACCVTWLNFLRERRDALAQRINAEAVLSEVDRRLAQSSELLNAGVFGNATTVSLLVLEAEADPAAISSPTALLYVSSK